MSRFEATFVIEPTSIAGSYRHRDCPAVGLRWLALFLLAFLFFCFPGATNARNVPSSPPDSVGPGLQFTIGDFDGDQKLDRIGVQVGESNSSGTKYWIDLQLSGSGAQSIAVNAATDGIQIAAQDVNGDHSLDLVLTTTWLHQPVAILLNDGHGVFTRITPAAFPGAFRRLSPVWTSPNETEQAPIADSLSSRLHLDAARVRLQDLSPRAERAEAARDGFSANPIHISTSGRAPPSSNTPR
jgi:hypothetical protein